MEIKKTAVQKAYKRIRRVHDTMEYIHNAMHTKFKIGEFDCFTFVYDYLKLVSDVDIPDIFMDIKYKQWKVVNDKTRYRNQFKEFFNTFTKLAPPFDISVGDIVLIDSDRDGYVDSPSIYIGNDNIAWVIEKDKIQVRRVPKALFIEFRRPYYGR